MTQEHFGLISGLLVVFLTAIWPMLASMKPPKTSQTQWRFIPAQHQDLEAPPKAEPVATEATFPAPMSNDIRQDGIIVDTTPDRESPTGPALGGP
ncbi:MAG: hypothetical protein EXS11_03830 [Gemmataceae bacterium]|nr:hypothetical protein [Gemmataceae bacterium]